jgi:hypothetical protein
MISRPRTADERVFFSYVDHALAEKFGQFLKMDHSTLTLKSSDLHTKSGEGV